MIRLLVVVALAAPIAVCLSAPVPKDAPKKDALYFPTKVGAKWVYQLRDGKARTDVVTAAEHKAKEDLWVVSVGVVDAVDRVVPEDEWHVSKTGLILTKCLGGKPCDPMQILKLPHKAGEKWPLHQPAEDVGFCCVALPARRVKVPAGEFEAVGVERYLKDTLLLTQWFAPGVGVVKTDDEKGMLHELKSFTPGKD